MLALAIVFFCAGIIGIAGLAAPVGKVIAEWIGVTVE